MARAGLGGVFFLHGAESFLRSEAVRQIVDAHLDPASRDFNLDRLQGSDADVETLASLIATPPMMAPWRVVLVQDAQGLTPKARAVVIDTTASPPPGLALILDTEIPARSSARFYKDLAKQAKSAEFRAFNDSEAPGWVIERGREAHGVEIDLSAAQRLVGAMGSDLGALASEVEKLADYAPTGRTISAEDVDVVCGSTVRENRWEWFDLVGERRFGEARERLPGLLASGESGVAVVAGIGTHLLRIGLARTGGRAAIESALGRYQRWLVDKVVRQAGKWPEVEISSALRAALRADRLLKSAAVADLHIIDELLLHMEVQELKESAA